MYLVPTLGYDLHKEKSRFKAGFFGVIIIVMNLLEIFFPRKCLECNKVNKYMCISCLDKVPVGGWYNNNYSIFRYKGVIRKAIITLKYKWLFLINLKKLTFPSKT